MTLMENFPSPPLSGVFTVAEKNGKMINIEEYKSDFLLSSVGIKYPEICISDQEGRIKPMLVDSEDSSLLNMKLFDEWYEYGITGALKDASAIESNNTAISALTTTCSYLLKSIQFASAVKNTIVPRAIPDIPAFLHKLSDNSDWSQSLIRDLRWHPEMCKMAVALHNDTVRLYEASVPASINHMTSADEYASSFMSTSPVVCCSSQQFKQSATKNSAEKSRHRRRSPSTAAVSNSAPSSTSANQTKQVDNASTVYHPDMVGITDMDWLRHSASKIAISCQNGLFIFDSPLFKQGQSKANETNTKWQLLASFRLGPLSSVVWCHVSEDIICSSPSTSNINILNTTTGEVTYFHVDSSGLTLVRLSPNGRYIAVTSRANSLYLFDRTDNNTRSFNNLAGTVKCICWSGTSETIMFSLTDCSALYTVHVLAQGDLAIREHSVARVQCASCVDGSGDCGMDVDGKAKGDGEAKGESQEGTEVEGEDEEDEDIMNVGGAVHSLHWDESNKRLAVAFKGNSKIIALFNVTYVERLMTYNISPGGYVRCRKNEDISFVRFHVNSNNHEILTLVLRNGNVRYIPLYGNDTVGIIQIDPLDSNKQKDCELFPTLDKFL